MDVDTLAMTQDRRPAVEGGLSWLGIIRLGLVQAALGAIVVLTTSTFNRVMVVELALPAMLPGALVAFHYAVQMLRPRWGYGSDIGGRCTPWIIGGMAVLALGGVAASLSVALLEVDHLLGIIALVGSFALIGVGVGAAGTTNLVLMSKEVAPQRRAPAATIVWLMMIAGLAITAGVAGGQLDPFSMTRLVVVTAVVATGAVILTIIAVAGLEKGRMANEQTRSDAADASEKPAFRKALAEVWAEPKARRFAIFVFVSMLAYNAQDLILEPYAGAVFGLTPGESTKLAGLQHGGVFLGMILIGVLGGAFGGKRLAGIQLGSLRDWAIYGCIASGLAFFFLASGAYIGQAFPLKAAVFALGVANGAFAVAAIGSMMALVGEGRARREGVRMGVWGAAQAVAFGLGGFTGTMAVDATRALFADAGIAYSTVFFLEGLLFLLSAVLAARVTRSAATSLSGDDRSDARDRTDYGERDRPLAPAE